MKRNPLFLTLIASSFTLLLAGCGGGGNSGDTAQAGSTQTNLSLSTTARFDAAANAAAKGIAFDTGTVPLTQSAITQRRLVTVKDADSWRALWAEHAGSTLVYRPAPDIDFSRRMVAAVFLGSRSACDSVSIEAIKEKSDPARIEVVYRESAPPAGTPCIASIANPAVMATLPASALPVEFVAAPVRADNELVVRSGWSFGLCVDNCDAEITVARDGAIMRVTRKPSSQLPDQVVWGSITADEWDVLAAKVTTLPDVVAGCPGCVDEGREWMEVEQAGKKKRIDFSCGIAVPGADAFQSTVRAIRSRLATVLGAPTACDPATLSFEPITPVVLSSLIAEKRTVSVRDATSWATLWAQHTGGNSAPPAIDFTNKMVAGVFLGPESVVCGSVQIGSVLRKFNPDRLEVGYRVIDPAPNVACLAAVVNQYALVSLPALPVPVEFVKLP